MSSSRRAIPVVEHLRGQHSIKDEPGHETVQDKFVINLLQGGVDSCETAKQVIEHSERRQLACAALAIHRQDLGQFAGDAERAGAGLKRGHLGVTDQRVRHHEGIHGTADGGDERAGLCAAARVREDQHADDHVLDGDQARLAVRAEREAVADVVRQRDDEAGRLEEVAAERQALGGLGGDELEDLRHLDHRRRRDDPDAQRLRDRERHAFRVWCEVEVEEERAVAFGAQQVQREAVERARQLAGDG